MEAVLDKKEGNTLIGSEGHYFDEAKGNIVFAPGKFVSMINVNDLIVVCNETSLVVLPKSDSQKVKDIVKHLEGTELSNKLL